MVGGGTVFADIFVGWEGGAIQKKKTHLTRDVWYEDILLTCL